LVQPHAWLTAIDALATILDSRRDWARRSFAKLQPLPRFQIESRANKITDSVKINLRSSGMLGRNMR
jgi:hypothetical protein